MIRDNLLVDSHGRVLRDLRVSVTDRCNFRCLYCLPETEAAANFYRGRWAESPTPPIPIHRQWAPRAHILSFEEIERVVRLAVDLGIEKVRLTGGEPLLRQELPKLVRKISAIPGIKDLALTTNGFLFAQHAVALREAGLQRVSFSLDSLDRANFQKMTGRDGLGSVLEAIRLAQELGFDPVKVNAVIIRGINDHEIEDLGEFARRESLSFRFIEFMPLDSGRAWQKDLVVTAREILSRLQSRYDLESVSSHNLSETAKRWKFKDLQYQDRIPVIPDEITPGERIPGERDRPARPADRSEKEISSNAPISPESDPLPLPFLKGESRGEGSLNRPDPPGPHDAHSASASARPEIGLIAPVSEPFCGHCNRLRLTADGKIRTCLFSVTEHDLRGLLRSGASDSAIQHYLQEVVWQKESGHRIGHEDFVPPSRTMSCIGG